MSFGIIVKGGTPKFGKREKRSVMVSMSTGVQRDICKDRAMHRAITEGDSSDKSLKSDITQMRNERKRRDKAEWRQQKRTRIDELKTRYRKRYGSDV